MTFDDELLISKTLLRIAPVPMPSKDSMDVAEMVRGVPSKLLVINNSFIDYELYRCLASLCVERDFIYLKRKHLNISLHSYDRRQSLKPVWTQKASQCDWLHVASHTYIWRVLT